MDDSMIEGDDDYYGLDDIAIPDQQNETIVNQGEGVIDLDGNNQTEKASDRNETEAEGAEEAQESDKAFRKKTRKPTSKVWEDFQQITDTKGERWAQCIYCKFKMKRQLSGPTTSLKRHSDHCTKKESTSEESKYVEFQASTM